MKKRIAVFLLCLMLALAPAAMADERMDTLDYAALKTFIASWNAAAGEAGIDLSFSSSLKDDYFTMSSYLWSPVSQKTTILDSLINPNIPINLVMEYFSIDDTVALVYDRYTLTDIPKSVEVYADGVKCGGKVEVYFAEAENENDLFTLEFSIDCIRTFLNAEEAFMRLTTDKDVYYQEISSEAMGAPYLMWSVLSEALNYSNRSGASYLDPRLLAPGDENEPQTSASPVPQAYSFQKDFEAIELAAQSVFLLEVYDANDQAIATGSGFVAFDSGTLITNEHVIDEAAYVIAYSDQYKASYKLLKLKAVDADKDIAILEFDAAANVTPLTVDTQSKLFRGQPVTAIGSPQGVINTVSSGNISNTVFYSEEIPDYIQFTAPISPGSSGGALFSDNGDVVGLCVSLHKEGEAMYYAIPMKYVEEMYINAHSKKTITLAQYNDMPSYLSAVKLQAPTLGENSIELKWSTVNKAEEYEVYRRDSHNLEFLHISTTNDNFFSDTAVVIGETYEYYVQAIHSWRSSHPSNKVRFTMIEPTPTPSPKPTPVPDATSGPQGKILFKFGNASVEIIVYKLRLYELGYYSSSNNFDSTFDDALKNAIKTFQQNNNLKATGNIDEATLNAFSAKNIKKGILEVPEKVKGFSNKTFKLHDKGPEIEELKKQLQTMGYYRSSSDFDDEYNQTMVERVKQFQKNNKLNESGILDYVTIIKLYSSHSKKGQWYVIPTPTPEPEKAVALVIPDDSYGQWDYVNGDGLKFRLQVKNTSKTRTITAYELYVYPVDVWGNRLIPEDRIYIISVETNLRPGKLHYSNYITMADAKKIDKVYVAVNKVKYSDGTVRTVSQHSYIYWEID